MTPTEKIVAERIRERGPISFAEFMELALYHPEHGYYSADRPRTGWRGHFLTSPELDPAFGELWCAGFRRVWEQCGSPEEFSIFEIGPGEGGFAHAVLDAATEPFASALRYRLIERNPRTRERQARRIGRRDNVEWATSIEDLPSAEAGVVFANEVLDNLPVHVIESHRGLPHELCVDVDDDGRLTLTLEPLSDARLLELVGTVDLPDGHRVELSLHALPFLKSLEGAIDKGALVFVDYGLEAEELGSRPGGTVVAYSAEGVDDSVLDRPGERDITCHVNWSTIRAVLGSIGCAPHGPRSQRTVLRALGAQDVDARLRAAHGDALGAGRGGDAVRALSQRQSLNALLDPGGLGSLGVLVGTKGIAPPDFISG